MQGLRLISETQSIPAADRRYAARDSSRMLCRHVPSFCSSSLTAIRGSRPVPPVIDDRRAVIGKLRAADVVEQRAPALLDALGDLTADRLPCNSGIVLLAPGSRSRSNVGRVRFGAGQERRLTRAGGVMNRLPLA
jgi:hypothetical protein